MRTTIMVMRSKLFVPASRPELFGKALACAADALSFDLEDAVAQSRKAEARANLTAFLRDLPPTGKTIVVRVNAFGTAEFEADLVALAGLPVDVINLPMAQDEDTVLQAIAAIERGEVCNPAVRPLKILLNIETFRALRKAARLASVHPRVTGLQIGYADLLEPCGIARSDSAALAHIRLAVRLAAAEAGIAAYDGAFAAVTDVEGYRAECKAAKRHGFAGKSCIHPSQITIANEIFMPDANEIAWARKVVSAAANAEASGIGAYLLDGQMIDKPFLERARAVVALAGRFQTEA
ncbi:CoA ester lyase [Bradyrhizobium sp. CB3481]|uniref:HpcH/HpaI aldolase/citrate lyase family protein n=1 Tax=Bradyrhizobium sp. CB3481 TaxID=3039158 RepID=UPI0024B1C56D|nr:CoA ester lyase [Bradyrhizobium sp. CB3481]WFU19427.1 CoA ester lyase [Bradyrhizobium sp. CB3481]